MSFERVVFWSGIWNVGLGLVLITPPIREFLGLQVPNPFWPWIVAVFLWYTAATLILSARDVQTFASVIYWEALLRFAAVALLIAYGFKYVGVVPTVLFAVTDFLWGLVYLVGLPRVTGRSHASLVVDPRVKLCGRGKLFLSEQRSPRPWRVVRDAHSIRSRSSDP
jgi:hypothetical protein